MPFILFIIFEMPTIPAFISRINIQNPSLLKQENPYFVYISLNLLLVEFGMNKVLLPRAI